MNRSKKETKTNQRKRGRPPKNNFWTIDEMTKYAEEKYPQVREKLKKLKEGDYSISPDSSDNPKTVIRRTLNEHRLLHEKNEKEFYVISEKIAKFVIDTLLYTEFTDKDEIRRKQWKEQEEERLREIEKQSFEKDKQLNQEQREISELFAYIDEKKYNGEEVDLIEELRARPNLAKNYDNNVHKCRYHYQLPNISSLPEYENDEGGLPTDLIDQMTDRMMLRALFDIFFYFNEEQFRKDLIHRSRLINPDDNDDDIFMSGYSKLTQMLLEPINNYVFPRNRTAGKSSKEICITVDPETEARLKQYTSEQNVSLSKAVTDWIWEQKLVN